MAKKETASILSFGRGHVIFVFDKDFVDEEDKAGTLWRKCKTAYTIRKWGTDAGLGQLANGGPLSGTIFDAIPAGLDIPVGSIHGNWKVADGHHFDSLIATSLKAL